MFDGEHVIALQRNQASSHGEWKVSCIFPSCGGNLAYILELRQGRPFKIRVCSVTSGLLSSYAGKLRNLHKDWQGNMDASRGDVGDPGSLSSCHSDSDIPLIFKKRQASSPFEPFNSVCLSRCQKDVRPPVQMWRGCRAFSRVSTGYSDIP